MRRVALLIALTAILVVSLRWSGQAQQPPPAPQFTGTTTAMDGKDLSVARRRFEPGARTYWHVHTSAQILVAEEGKGRYQEKGNAPKDFVPGQPVSLKPNIAHWHGAAPDSPLTQATMYSGSLMWMGPVTDDEYSGKKK